MATYVIHKVYRMITNLVVEVKNLQNRVKEEP